MKKFQDTGEAHRTDVDLTFDLVCGMELVQREAKYSFKLNDVMYYFCTSTCREHFKNAPERYLTPDLEV